MVVVMTWTGPPLRRAPASRPSDTGGVRPSPGLAQLLASLERLRRPASILDLGPAEESTLKFLGDRGMEVQVAALAPDANGRVKLPKYDSAAFRAILAWDYLVRVEPGSRVALAQSLSSWLAPGGDLFLVLPISAVRPCFAYRFRIHGQSELDYRPVGRPLGNAFLSTREVLSLFPALQGSGARILRHGAREFLLRREALGD